jgi:hypothetical protein
MYSPVNDIFGSSLAQVGRYYIPPFLMTGSEELMPQSNQESTARRFQSFDTENVAPHYDAGYECELPPGVRSELVTLRRPPIANRPIPVKMQPRGAFYFVLGICLITLAGTLYTSWRQSTAKRARNKAISQPLAPQPTPIPPAPEPTPHTSWQSYLAALVPAM